MVFSRRRISKPVVIKMASVVLSEPIYADKVFGEIGGVREIFYTITIPLTQIFIRT